MDANSSFIERRLVALKARHLSRKTKTVLRGAGPWVNVDGIPLLNLSSNNYLGLAGRPELREAADEAARLHGWGAGASRLLTGTTEIHDRLEARLSAFKGFEAGLLFTSGYAANLGILQGLVGGGDYIVGDALNHASLIDGAKLSGATYLTYQHLRTDALEAILRRLGKRSSKGRRLVVTETVFSMDGDIAPLNEIAEVCDRYGALLMVDEAHATGCIGAEGKGLASEMGLSNQIIVSMSTLSKALGSFGGIAASSFNVRSYLVNHSRSFIYTTGIPAPVVAASEAALTILENEPDLVNLLRVKAELMRNGLRSVGFNILASNTQIIPIVAGSPQKALEFAMNLEQRGLYTVAVRPPSVSPGASRVRLSIMASHETPDLVWALEVLKRAGLETGLI